MSDYARIMDIDEELEAEREKWESKYFGLYREDTPQYLYEGCRTEDEYEEDMIALANDLFDESKDKWRELKVRWTRAALRLEMFESLAAKTTIDRTDMPIMPQAIEESISLMCEGLTRPVPKASESDQDEFIPPLALFMDREMTANSFDMLMGKVIYNQKTMFMGILKTTYESGKPGPYTKDGRITSRVVDTRYFWADPMATSHLWEDAKYWIFAEPQDSSDVRDRFPGKGHLAQVESDWSINRLAKDGEVQSVGNYKVGKRERVLVKECWIKDDRKIFVPDLDEDGNEIPIDDAGRDFGNYKNSRRNKEAVQGTWVPKYPHGRLLVVAGDVLLEDRANPFPHGEPPYTLFPARITQEIFSWSDVELLGRIEDKINRLHKDMIRNARVNMNSPWVADRNCFDSPRKFNLLTQDPGLVLPVTPGSKIMRLPPAELPQFIFPMLNWLRGIFDDMLGVQAIMRGQLEKGSQLSAGAVENLQVSSSSRMRYRAKLFENGLKHYGHQLSWMIRTFYPSEFTVQTKDPRTGQDIPLKWTAPPAQMGNFEIGMDIGSGLPNSSESGSQMYLKLWQLDLVPRIAVLQALKVPNAEKVAQAMEQEDLRQAQLGIVMRRNKNGQAGRKAIKA